MALFIAEYPKDFNATAAAARAGYKWPDKIGPRMLKHPAVAAAIATQVKEKVDRVGLDVDRTLEEVRRLAFFDPIDLLEDDGSVKRMRDIPPEARAAIVSFEVLELFEGNGDDKHCYGILKKIRLADKNSSLDKSMRYNALYRDKLQVDLNDPFGRMTNAELETYAATGELPEWVNVAVTLRGTRSGKA